ncbi:MAG: phosphate ABC transporter substrate-binding protein [Gemmatimonadota bacterium]
MRKLLSLVAIALVSISATTSVQAQDVKVIVNSANPLSEMPAGEVAGLFLKRTAKFPSGTAAVPVDQAKSSAVRGTFARTVLGRPASAVDAYWQQQIFAGGELPPAVKASDDDVIAFVKSTPGAIGYVSAGASVAGVKVVTVK